MFIESYIDIWKNWKSLVGRMRRDRYWEAFACNVFVMILLTMLSYRVGGPFVYIQGIYYIVSMIPFFTASLFIQNSFRMCKFMHDNNNTSN